MYTTYRNVVFMLKHTNNVVADEKKKKKRKEKKMKNVHVNNKRR